MHLHSVMLPRRKNSTDLGVAKDDFVTTTGPGQVLTLNLGSATLKSNIYETGDPDKLLLSITVDKDTSSASRLKITNPAGSTLLNSLVGNAGSCETLEVIFAWLLEHKMLSRFAAVGHRLVHGGPHFREPLRLTAQFLSDIEQLASLDPDHLPQAIRGIQFISRKSPEIPQAACFDTSFHRSLPNVARMYALPRRFYDQGIVRYGFHGLSYEYMMCQLSALEATRVHGRVIIAHLGSEASLVAVNEGKSVDTSMGFTPLEGLVMGTRSGDVDAGALLHLIEQQKISPSEMSVLLNKQSGLLGVSETSADMRDLLDKESTDKRAAEAVELFCYRVKKIYRRVCRGSGRIGRARIYGGNRGACAHRPPTNLCRVGISGNWTKYLCQ